MPSGRSRFIITISVHVLAWALLGFALMFYHPLTWSVKLPSVFWINQLFRLFILVILFYANASVFVPSLVLKNRFFYFALWVLLAIAVTVYLSNLTENLLQVRHQIEQLNKLPPRGGKSGYDIFIMMASLLVLGISTSITVVQRWQKDARIREAMEKQQISSELSFLKAQINPHFFFNTLNNIYALSFTDMPLSRDALHKLSRMMRYLLYETQHDTTLLKQEISFVKDYIALMKLRLNPTAIVTFSEPQLSRDHSIAPMLLLPFVENAFKHGVSATEQTRIEISIAVDDDILHLIVENTIYDNNALIIENGGIGLANTQRRLDLLYPGRHTLLIRKDDDENRYIVELKIRLS
ncbi:histidine kinase [Pedobacter sp. BS3]|uniref:sensor histidine kinase n=1 Tax=Pedobacter sp. BS3 TaxID=2567937 RepID=UPI0011EECC5B|nr:histidine kinase [Pedobacter sp. BS3]TZF84712.1 histidine kinase [Pedobacter sp. BS3]